MRRTLALNTLNRRSFSPRSRATACRPRHRSYSDHSASSDARSSTPKSIALAVGATASSPAASTKAMAATTNTFPIVATTPAEW
uniref:Uncharacterized protein n=1 Tax=Arundo donax TaxID=35708 RepID=A0A0A9E409_ARUDO